MLEDAGVNSVKLPPRSPNLNAYAERFVRTMKESCLERMILFGETSLRTALHNFVAHYHTERNHQGLAPTGSSTRNQPILARQVRSNGVGDWVACSTITTVRPDSCQPFWHSLGDDSSRT